MCEKKNNMRLSLIGGLHLIMKVGLSYLYPTSAPPSMVYTLARDLW